MKKLATFIFVFCLTFLYQNMAQAYCLVSSSTTYTEASLPYQLNKNYNGKGTEATCGTKTGQLDFQSGFDQGIYFTNSTWWSGYKDKVDVKTIVLTAPLTLNNSVKDLVIGNWANVKPNSDSAFKNFAWDYPDFFDPTSHTDIGDKEYGVVTIDGSKLPAGTLPMQCATGTSLVALRNLVIITHGVSEEDFWQQTNKDAAADAEDPTQCLRDGGNVVVQTVVPVGTPGCQERVEKEGKEVVCVVGDECINDPVCKEDVPPPVCDNAYIDQKSNEVACLEAICKDHPACQDVTPDTCYKKVTNALDPVKALADILAAGGTDECYEEILLFLDGDEDHYCESSAAINKCLDGSTPGDCNDFLLSVHPNAAECNAAGTCAAECKADGTADGVDNDCDGTKDNGCKALVDGGDEDIDGDGFCAGSDACKDAGLKPKDCNDNDKLINPGVVEICTDEVDNNCDGAVNEACAGDEDLDLDGYCANPDKCTDATLKPNDCDDNKELINPNAIELCDEVDNDCDGATDEVCKGELTEDDDGDGFCEDPDACSVDGIEPGDCDDTNENIFFGAPEICDNNIDENCNGTDGIQIPVAGGGDAGSGGGDVKSGEGGAAKGFFVIKEIDKDAADTCVPADIVDPLGSGSTGGCSCDLSGQGKATPVPALVLLAMIFLAPVGFMLALRWRRV